MVEKPPNLRTLIFDKSCINCEHSHNVEMNLIGMWCSKYDGVIVRKDYICDNWEKQKSEKKKYKSKDIIDNSINYRIIK